MYFTNIDEDFKNHECTPDGPLGTQIYEDEEVKIFKVNGKDYHDFSLSLQLVAKLFLECKVEFHQSIDKLILYTLYEKRTFTDLQFCGYFSTFTNFKSQNLSCFVVLPYAQAKGYGKFLIDLSYQIKKGMPERPFSLQGFHTYISYWKWYLLRWFLEIMAESDEPTNKLKPIEFKKIEELSGVNEESIRIVFGQLKIPDPYPDTDEFFDYWESKYEDLIPKKIVKNVEMIIKENCSAQQKSA